MVDFVFEDVKIKDKRLKIKGLMDYFIESNEIFVINEKHIKYRIDLRKRLFEFAANVIRLLMKLPVRKEFDVLRYQLSKSATSIGANYEESQAGSKAEFRQKINICLRESRETNYWLRLIKELNILNGPKLESDLKHLIKESEEIQKIFGSISSKVKKNKIKD